MRDRSTSNIRRRRTRLQLSASLAATLLLSIYLAVRGAIRLEPSATLHSG
jgi:hypothetical protein